VKSNLKAFVFWIVAMSLASVLVGGALSFHAEVPFKSSQVSAQQCEIQNTSSHDSHEHDLDPCSQGHCHLGHCGVVLMPSAPGLVVEARFPLLYNSKRFILISRFLDGPFQPPRAS
jgi:hypothetical protein